MVLLEYEAKNLLRAAGLEVPSGHVAKYFATIRDLHWPLMVKAQIPAGGRGKAGGVLKARDAEELDESTRRLLGSQLLNYPVDRVLIEEAADSLGEMYVAIALDRTEQAFVLLAARGGGVDVHDATEAKGAWHRVLNGAPSQRQIVELGAYLELDPQLYGQLEAFVTGLWNVSSRNDAVLVEVNPLILTADNHLLCADAKIELDDAAAFRHPGWQFEQAAASTQFVVLDASGAVASMANGAGLAMATVDAITAAGAAAANFFDCGGGSSTAEMTRGFEQISALKQVRAVVVNIYAGITRCDEVAGAILAARKTQDRPLPLFVRLEGTNAEAGRAILEAGGISTLPSLAECVAQAVEAVSHA